MIEGERLGRPRAAPAGPQWYRDLTAAWSRSLSRRGRARGTQRTYWWLVRDFGRWLEHCRILAPDHLVVEVLYSLQHDLVERGVSASTLSLASVVLRGLLRWGARERFGVEAALWEHVETVDRQPTQPRPLEPDQLAGSWPTSRAAAAASSSCATARCSCSCSRPGRASPPHSPWTATRSAARSSSARRAAPSTRCCP